MKCEAGEEEAGECGCENGEDVREVRRGRHKMRGCTQREKEEKGTRCLEREREKISFCMHTHTHTTNHYSCQAREPSTSGSRHRQERERNNAIEASQCPAGQSQTISTQQRVH